MFSEKTRASLRRAGWSEGRRVDAEPAVRWFRSQGREPPPLVRATLEEFGGLTVRHPHARARSGETWFRVGVEPTWPAAAQQVVEKQGERLGLELYVIGSAEGDAMELSMDPEGRVYAHHEQDVFLVGHSARDAFDAMCTGRPFRPVTGGPRR